MNLLLKTGLLVVVVVGAMIAPTTAIAKPTRPHGGVAARVPDGTPIHLTLAQLKRRCAFKIAIPKTVPPGYKLTDCMFQTAPAAEPADQSVRVPRRQAIDLVYSKHGAGLRLHVIEVAHIDGVGAIDNAGVVASNGSFRPPVTEREAVYTGQTSTGIDYDIIGDRRLCGDNPTISGAVLF